MSLDTSYNIFTTYKNNKCLTSAQSVLNKYVNNNASNDDMIYDFENEKVNITSQYCTKKDLEETKDIEGNIDCKLTKNKPMLESIFGESLLNTINTKYNTNDYEQCNTNEFDGALINIIPENSNIIPENSNIIPENFKELIKPLTQKYGPIEKSLCFDKTYGCSLDKELVNGVCYNKCPDGYLQNPDKKNECYKLYPTFENNEEFKNADIITKKIKNIHNLPKNVCPSGYTYNDTEKKCIENCADGYIYQGNGNCKKNYPVKWDGTKNEDNIIKNAIWSQSKVRELKCLNPNKPNLIDGLCYANCPPGHVHVPGAPYTCRPEPCPEGYHKQV